MRLNENIRIFDCKNRYFCFHKKTGLYYEITDSYVDLLLFLKKEENVDLDKIKKMFSNKYELINFEDIDSIVNDLLAYGIIEE